MWAGGAGAQARFSRRCALAEAEEAVLAPESAAPAGPQALRGVAERVWLVQVLLVQVSPGRAWSGQVLLPAPCASHSGLREGAA